MNLSRVLEGGEMCPRYLAGLSITARPTLCLSLESVFITLFIIALPHGHHLTNLDRCEPAVCVCVCVYMLYTCERACLYEVEAVVSST